MMIIEFIIYMLLGSVCTLIGLAGSRGLLKEQIEYNEYLLDKYEKVLLEKNECEKIIMELTRK